MELQEEIKLLEKKLELLKQIQEIQVKLNEAVKYVPVYPTFPTFPQPEPYHYGIVTSDKTSVLRAV